MTPAQAAFEQVMKLREKATPGPWDWQQFGKEWCLTAQYGHRHIVLSTLGRKGELASLDMQRIVMVPFDPEHPNSELIVAAVNFLALLPAYVAEQRDAALEEAAKLVESAEIVYRYTPFPHNEGLVRNPADELAAVIRALKGNP